MFDSKLLFNKNLVIMKSKIENLFIVSVLFLFMLGLTSTTNHVSLDEEVGGAYLTFAEKFGGKVTQSDLMKTSEIGVEGCARGSKIFKFKLVITKGKEKSTHLGNSPKLTQAMLKDLRVLSKGDEFIFKKVKAYLPDGKSEVDVWGKIFTVV